MSQAAVRKPMVQRGASFQGNASVICPPVPMVSIGPHGHDDRGNRMTPSHVRKRGKGSNMELRILMDPSEHLDRAFGAAFRARVRAMGIRDRPTSFQSLGQNGHVERLIGSIRRECTDHLIVFNAEHLRRILAKYATLMRCERTFAWQGRALHEADRAVWRHNLAADPGRVAPSIRPDLVFGNDRVRFGSRLTTTLRTLAHTVGEPDKLLPAFGCGSDDDQQALRSVF